MMPNILDGMFLKRWHIIGNVTAPRFAASANLLTCRSKMIEAVQGITCACKATNLINCRSHWKFELGISHIFEREKG